MDDKQMEEEKQEKERKFKKTRARWGAKDGAERG